MEDLIVQYGRLVGEIGLAGAACYALVRVWQQMIKQADDHRKDTAEQDKVHRDEIKALEQKHREDLISLNREHRDHVASIVERNMDEHRERNRVQVLGWRETAAAFMANGLHAPNPYPHVDEMGKEDPRK